VFLSSTTVNGRLYLRLCVLSFRTHADRVRAALGIIRAAARGVAKVGAITAGCGW
jgi:aromatic-L-amino-acid decarboxylase